MAKATRFKIRFVRVDRPEVCYAFPCTVDGVVLVRELTPHQRAQLEACIEAAHSGKHWSYVEGDAASVPSSAIYA